MILHLAEAIEDGVDLTGDLRVGCNVACQLHQPRVAGVLHIAPQEGDNTVDGLQ